jgi:acyl dehydratase
MATFVSKTELTSYIGKELEPGPWFKINQERINQFADVTVDHQFIHVDPDKAKDTPFGSTIAHGFLSLSMLTHLCEEPMLMPNEVAMALNYGFDKVRFLNPVTVDSEIRACCTIADVTEKPGNQYLVKQAISIEINGVDKPALICEWLTMFICS